MNIFIKAIIFIVLLLALVASFLFSSLLPVPIAVIAIMRVLIVGVMIRFYLQQIYLPNRFFWVTAGIITLYIVSFFLPFLESAANATLGVFGTLIILDLLLVHANNIKLKAERIAPKFFSLGDVNNVRIKISHNFPLPLRLDILDELPTQLQKRDFEIPLWLSSGEPHTIVYQIEPKVRGDYKFNDLHVFVRSILGLVQRRISNTTPQHVPVYPSVIQMKKFELMALKQTATMSGVKKMRRIGHSYEFEQIRNYVKGDDYRSINWKATSRRNQLMVNQYEDERSQQIFCVIDKGRAMMMPFGGMSLLDYAINTSLVISNIALHKHDKAGLLTFSDKIGATVKADSGARQLRLIIEALYKEEVRNLDGNYELLYMATKQFITRRSLILLYTNFESYSAMQRQLPILRRIARMHLLVIVFFENTEIRDFAQQPANTTEEIYHQTIANRFVYEKHRIVQELNQYGIQAILTAPEDLSVNTVNKYLELKARNMI
jgi:uncharacterized protein (DUF58 family)